MPLPSNGIIGAHKSAKVRTALPSHLYPPLPDLVGRRFEPSAPDVAWAAGPPSSGSTGAPRAGSIPASATSHPPNGRPTSVSQGTARGVTHEPRLRGKLKRPNNEIRGRTTVVGIFPKRPRRHPHSLGAVLADRHDEWAVARRYFSAASLAKLSSCDPDPLPPPNSARPDSHQGTHQTRTPALRRTLALAPGPRGRMTGGLSASDSVRVTPVERGGLGRPRICPLASCRRGDT